MIRDVEKDRARVRRAAHALVDKRVRAIRRVIDKAIDGIDASELQDGLWAGTDAAESVVDRTILGG